MLKFRTSSAVTVVFSACCCVAITMAGTAPPPRLSPAEQRSISMACQSYYQGNPLGVLESLSPLVAKCKEEKLALLDKTLASKQVPAAGKLLAEARLAVAQQGFSKRLPRPEAREIRIVLPPIRQRVLELLDLASRDPVLADPLKQPDDLAAFDPVLWSIHVLENRLETATRLADYAASLAKSFPRPLLQKMNDMDRQVVTDDYAGLSSEAKKSLAELEEREAELRIHRLAAARQVLERPELTKERVLAAYTSAVDARVLAEFFDQSQKDGRSFTRSALQDPGITNQVATDANRALKLAGDLTAKAQLLFEGLHWWFRGRYGLGSDVDGLAKSPAALSSPQAMFALYMPAITPKPTDPIGKLRTDPSPKFDRRHHYWWAWEDRRLLKFAPNLTTTKKTESLLEISVSQFY